MSPSCPISTKRVDSNMVRIIAFQIMLLTVLFIFTQEKLITALIFVDFILRALRFPQFSPLTMTARALLTFFSVEPKLSDEAPKRFSLYLGVAISFLIALFILLGVVKVALFLALILLTCALLEALFDFCIGCKLYYVIQIIKGMTSNDRNLN